MGSQTDEVKTWRLPAKLITSRSSFFAAALRGGWAEASSKSVDLPEEDPRDFGYWVMWLYTGKLSLEYMFPSSYHESHAPYIAAWILGEKLGCHEFQDTAMLYFMRKLTEEEFFGCCAREAYEGSVTGSKLR